MKQFTITMTDGKPKTVKADIWQNSGSFILFTVQEGGTVFAIQSQFVMSIESVQPAEAPALTKAA